MLGAGDTMSKSQPQSSRVLTEEGDAKTYVYYNVVSEIEISTRIYGIIEVQRQGFLEKTK